MLNFFKKQTYPAATAEQSEEQVALLQSAYGTIANLEMKLDNQTQPDALPYIRIFGDGDELYTKRENLIQLRKQELEKIRTKTCAEDVRITQLKNFNDTLNAALLVLNNMDTFMRAIKDPANNLAKQTAFKNNENDVIRLSAKQFIPVACEVYERCLNLFQITLNGQADIHTHTKERDHFNYLANTLRAAENVVTNPRNLSYIKDLLNASLTLTQDKNLDNSRNQDIFGRTLAVCGACLTLTCMSILIATPPATLTVAVALSFFGLAHVGMLLMIAGVITASSSMKKERVDATIEATTGLVKHTERAFMGQNLPLPFSARSHYYTFTKPKVLPENEIEVAGRRSYLPCFGR